MGPGNLQIELRSVRSVMMMPFQDSFFFEPAFEPPKVNLRHRNKKKSVKNVDRTRTEASNCAKHGPGSNYSPVETTFRKRVVVVAGIRK